MTTMVHKKNKITHVMLVLSRQVVAEPNRHLCGPRCVARALSRAPTKRVLKGHYNSKKSK